MNQCIVVEREDGGVSIIHPNPRMQYEGETEADFMQRMAASEPEKSGFVGRPVAVIPTDTLPQRSHKNAVGETIDDRAGWVWRNNLVEVDTKRTRPIQAG